MPTILRRDQIQASWFDFIVGNSSTSEEETSETITLEGSSKTGVSSQIIYKGTTYKRFDLNDESQSYILSTSNSIIAKQY